MKIPNSASAHVRIGLVGGRPLDAILQIRVRCWLTRVACLIERRDTPHTEATPRPAPEPR